MPSKIYQVRYSVGDKNVAHEHYTEKGAKADAKQLSKAVGNAMVGELDVLDDGARSMVRVWEFTGGEIGKPIKREGPPSEVEVIKTAEQMKLPDAPVKEKVKAPKLTEAEKIAKKRAEAEALIKSIDEGTYVAPVRGRKPGTGTPRAPRDEADRIKKVIEDLKCSEKAAQIIAGAGLNANGRRTQVTVAIIDNNGPILATEVVSKLNAVEGKEPVELKEVVGAAYHVKFKLLKLEQPWTFSIKEHGENDYLINLAAVKIEYTEQAGETAQAAE